MTWNEEEYDAFEKGLTEKYPEMFSQPYGGVAVGAGWWPIIQSLCSQIDAYTKWKNNTAEARLKDSQNTLAIPAKVPQVVVQQIKEKFGGLRFYYEGGDEHIAGMVRMAEMWASHSCEECGAPGKSRTGGWVKTLCDKHEAERQERFRQREMKASGLEE